MALACTQQFQSLDGSSKSLFNKSSQHFASSRALSETTERVSEDKLIDKQEKLKRRSVPTEGWRRKNFRPLGRRKKKSESNLFRVCRQNWVIILSMNMDRSYGWMREVGGEIQFPIFYSHSSRFGSFRSDLDEVEATWARLSESNCIPIPVLMRFRPRSGRSGNIFHSNDFPLNNCFAPDERPLSESERWRRSKAARCRRQPRRGNIFHSTYASTNEINFACTPSPVEFRLLAVKCR